MKPKPSTAAERLADLATNAKADGKQEIAEVILKVKAEKETEENLKGLKNAKKAELVSTYAYLIDKEEKDKEVSSLTVDGLKSMILHRLNTLMPKECEKCRKDHTQDREEIPKVTCLRCDHQACPECFSEPKDGWVYVCQPCKKVVKDDLGLNRLGEKHLLKSARSKKKTELLTLDEKNDEEEEEEDDDTSDEATQPFKTPGDEEKEEAEGIEEGFLPEGWKKRGFKNKDTKNNENGEKTKVCIHHRKGRCKFGLSGKMKVDGEWKKCPFAHPRVCEKLLCNGNRGKLGCKGDCRKLHPKMCYSSLNTRKCPYDKQCRNGYHVRGTIKTENTASRMENAHQRGGRREENSCPQVGNCKENAWPRIGQRKEKSFPQAGPSNQSGTPPFFDLGQIVREEILQVLKDLKLTAPPQPTAPKTVSKEDLKEALKEILM